MALEMSDFFTKCAVISIPNEYINSLYTAEQVNKESFLYGMRSNSLIANEATILKFRLGKRLQSQRSLVPMIFKFNLNETELSFKRYVNVIVDQCVKDDTIVLSEELLFNLQISTDQCLRTTTINSIFLTVNTDTEELISPARASKVVVSLFQTQQCLDANLIDELLRTHFLLPMYLCNGDVFGIEINKDYAWYLNNKVKCCTIYFKVVELEGPAFNKSETSKGFFVDNAVTMYQASNCRGFLPRRNVSLCYKPNLYSILSNEDVMTNILTHSHYLVPTSFNDTFDTLCKCMKPFFTLPQKLEGLGLSPLFLFTGPNGSGKSLLLQSASQFFGVRYCRIYCTNVGGAIPGQGETKLKTIFNQLKNIAPCILHLSNIEALCKDADNKEDVRLMCCFEEQLKALQSKWPFVVVATSNNLKSLTSSWHHLFLDSVELGAPNCENRQSIISWLFHYNSENIDTDILHAAASQTSGFVFRDLEVLVRLAFKEKFKRSKDKSEYTELLLSDFTKIIGTMHKAFSESIGAPKVPSVLWKDVGGLEHLKKEILRSLRSNMFSSGLKRSGLLLHGPPGTGKTLLAKAVATQCGRNFLSVKGPELLNMYVGQSEHNVRDLFEMAKAASPCIIFFDELDSLAPNRGRSGDSGGVMDRVVSQLLAEMDHLGDSGDVFILGATNRPDLIDPALLRPGRLDKLLYVGPCEDRNLQLGVLTALTHKLYLDQDVDLQEIVFLLPSSVTGAQLSAVCSAAWLSSARQIINSDEEKNKTAVTINRDHFTSALRAVFK